MSQSPNVFSTNCCRNHVTGISGIAIRDTSSIEIISAMFIIPREGFNQADFVVRVHQCKAKYAVLLTFLTTHSVCEVVISYVCTAQCIVTLVSQECKQSKKLFDKYFL